MKHKLLHITSVPISFNLLLKEQHHFMLNYFDISGVLSQGKELENGRLNEGIREEVLEMTRTIAPISDLRSLWKFYKLCKREKPKIAHLEDFQSWGLLNANLKILWVSLSYYKSMRFWIS